VALSRQQNPEKNDLPSRQKLHSEVTVRGTGRGACSDQKLQGERRTLYGCPSAKGCEINAERKKRTGRESEWLCPDEQMEIVLKEGAIGRVRKTFIGYLRRRSDPTEKKSGKKDHKKETLGRQPAVEALKI